MNVLIITQVMHALINLNSSTYFSYPNKLLDKKKKTGLL